jgi:MYND finger
METRIWTDEIGRSYCFKHRKDICHECCYDFVMVNEMAEVSAGLRKPPSRASELAKDKMNLQRGIQFMLKQEPQMRERMKENLEWHKTEMNKTEKEIAKLMSEPGDKGAKFAREFEEAWKHEIDLARTNDAENVALAQGLHALNPGSDTVEIGGPETQRLFDAFVAPPPSANRDQAVDPYTCSFCRKVSTTKLPSCSRCKKQAYCSKDCQVKHWKAHKKFCEEVENLDKKDSKKLPLTWAQLEAFGTAEGKKLEVRFMAQEAGFRLIAICKDRSGVAKRVAAYTDSRGIPGFTQGKVMVWKNPRFHYFMDGSSGARIEESDLANITIK